MPKALESFSNTSNEGPYSCGICGEYYSGNDIWWNLDGLRCRNCWRNIKEGVIPQLKDKFDKSAEYFQDWQIKSDFGVHPATREKLKRQGLLIGRDLTNEKGHVYCTIYLVSENQEFLKKYPRKDWKIKTTVLDDKGRKVEL